MSALARFVRILAALALAAVASTFTFLAFVWLFELGKSDVLRGVAQSPSENLGLGELASLGEYLNARYGLPLTAIVGVLTALIAAIAALWASRQNDVDILNFVENKADRAQGRWLQLLNALDELILHAVVRRQQIRQAIDEFESNSAVPASVTPPESSDRSRSSALERVQDVASRTRHAFVHQAENAREIIEGCMRDMYVSYFMRRWQSSKRIARPMRYIADHLADDDEVKTALKEDVLGVGNQLRNLSTNIPDARIISAAYIDFPDADAIEVAGYMIGPYWVGLKAPVDVPSGKIVAVGFNVGAAQLLSIWLSIPSKSQIESGLTEIFNYGASIARTFLRRVVLDAKLAAPSRLSHAFTVYADRKNFRRLILVCVQRDDGRFQYERYDATRHMRLPISSSDRV